MERKEKWDEFIKFMKSNPEALLNLIPSPKNTIDYNSQSSKIMKMQ